jgi:peptidoglycan glycosyltransferase
LVGDGTEDAIIQSSFGQGKTIVTPLLMNMITCAIANDGQVMEPKVIDSVKAADGTVVKEYNASVYKRLMKSTESQILKDLMVQVVQVGTASKLKGLNYSVAGKTGSAEYDSSKVFSHSWFTGFVPAEDPEIAVTIIMEQAGTGSSYAVPAAKRIFDAYFDVE